MSDAKPTSFTDKKSTLSGVRMAARKLEVIAPNVYESKMKAVYEECQDNPKPLEKLKDGFDQDLRFISSTVLHLQRAGKLTDVKVKEYDELRINIEARREFVTSKISQFREEHREVLEKQNLRSSIGKKFEDLSLEDLKAVESMLDKHDKPLSSMVVTEAAPDINAGGMGSAMLAAISGFKRGTLKKVTPGEKVASPSVKHDEHKNATKPTIKLEIKNPYQALLDMKADTAAKELPNKSTKEIRELRAKILELNILLIKETAHAKEKNPDAAALKEQQRRELAKIAKVADQMLDERREIEREKSDFIKVLQAKIKPLDGDDLQALNTLLKNSGNKRLTEFIDLSGNQIPPVSSQRNVISAAGAVPPPPPLVTATQAPPPPPPAVAAPLVKDLKVQLKDQLKQAVKNPDAIRGIFKAAKKDPALLGEMLGMKDSNGKYALAYLKPQDMKEVFEISFSDKLGAKGSPKRERRETEVLEAVHKHLVNYGTDNSWLSSATRVLSKVEALSTNLSTGKRGAYSFKEKLIVFLTR